jgi:hypothetical protein
MAVSREAIDHRPGRIGYLSPELVHAGDDHATLTARYPPYANATEPNSPRWPGRTCGWSPPVAVTLNPRRDSVVTTQAGRSVASDCMTEAITTLTRAEPLRMIRRPGTLNNGGVRL